MIVLNSEQMRALDKLAIDKYHIPELLLMESAALRVVESIERRYKSSKGLKIAVVCGKGNNGGDGFAVARHLESRGTAVDVWLAADAQSVRGVAATNLDLVRDKGSVQVVTEKQLPQFVQGVTSSDLIVDALFGTGFHGAVTGIAGDIIKAINNAAHPIVSVDVPSGLNADTGAVDEHCVRATWTVTFAALKMGLVLFPGAEYAGTIEVASIGMPQDVWDETQWSGTWLTAHLPNLWFPPRTRSRDANKGRYGHAAVIAGGAGFLGAAQLSAEAAARTGAGLVTLASPDAALTVIQSRLNPVVMTRSLASTLAGTAAGAALDDALELAARCTCAAIGPGLGIGHSEETAQFARDFIRKCAVPLVIDADGLVALSKEPDRGVAIMNARQAPSVITPHPGEMAKLLGISTDDVQADRPGAAKRAAKDYNAVVVLKGDRSLIATPQGALFINSTGNPGMATGGAGDALTGIIAGLLAQGLGPLEAAATGVYLHGLSGDIAVEKRGAREGLIATDLIEHFSDALCRMRGVVDEQSNEGVIEWSE